MLDVEESPQDSRLIPPLILPVVVEQAVVGVSEAGLPSLTMPVVEDMNPITPPAELVPMTTTMPESRLPPPPGFAPFVWPEDDGGMDVEDLCARFSEDSSLTLSPFSRGSSDIPNTLDVPEGGACCPPPPLKRQLVGGITSVGLRSLATAVSRQ